MKMEAVEQELRKWGEIIITTASGESYEMHIGDVTFDSTARVIKLDTPHAEYVIDGDSVETVTKHFGQKEDS